MSEQKEGGGPTFFEAMSLVTLLNGAGAGVYTGDWIVFGVFCCASALYVIAGEISKAHQR